MKLAGRAGPYGAPVTKLFVLIVVCPLLGSAVFASVAALGFTVASLPRLWLQYRARALRASNG